MPAKQIQINPQGTIVYSDARVGASKSGADTITWRNLGTVDCRVVFISSSPFGTGIFDVPAGGTINSGTISASASLTKHRYEVWRGGVLTDDPDIIIEG